MTGYGKKGGTSPTAGQKSEVIMDLHGHYKKRVFKGQRWLAISRKDEAGKLFIWAYGSRQKADACVNGSLDDGYDVAFTIEARTQAEWKAGLHMSSKGSSI